MSEMEGSGNNHPLSIGSTPHLEAGSKDDDQGSTPIESSPTPQTIPNQVNTSETYIDICDDDNTQTLTGKRKLTSSVWNHFEKKKIDGVDKAICNYCEKKLGGDSKNGTKHLHDHFKRCPLKKQRDIRQTILNPNKDVSGKVTIGTYTFEQEIARKELSNMILLHEYPLSMVEHIGFRRFMNVVQPLFKVVSRNSIKNDIFKIYDHEKSKTMSLLEKNRGRIALTTDMWTSNQKKGFMAVTAHFIDDSWVLQSRILRFIYVPCPHTSEVLCDTLMGCLLDWNIDRKLSTLTVDNCSTNDALINLLLDKLSISSLLLDGQFFHIRCCAHILNLIVKDGLEVISGSVEQIRDSVAYWTATPKREEKFFESARQLKVPCNKKLTLDCKTRWNSTYVMLNIALKYKLVFPRLKQRESQYRCLPSDQDWELANEICDRLELFYEVTELFSGTKYPTANIYFPQICEIKLSIYDWLNSSHDEIKRMASSMILKFEKYWNHMHGILAVATILDPRFKMKMVECYFPMIYENESSNEIEKIRKVCFNLVTQYQSMCGLREQASNSHKNSNASSSQPDALCEKKRDRLAKFDLFVCNTTNIDNVKSELEYYLEEAVLPRSNEFDILIWWKANATKYPTLHNIARDILAIPVSTVASESAFSTSGRFVSPHRNRLHPKTLEALMCTQDWLWAEVHGSCSSVRKEFCSTTLEDIDIDEEESIPESCVET